MLFLDKFFKDRPKGLTLPEYKSLSNDCIIMIEKPLKITEWVMPIPAKIPVRKAETETACSS